MLTTLCRGRLYRLIPGLVAAICMFLCQGAAGQEPDEQPEVAVIPATRAGNQLVWVLKVVNGQELGDLTEHFTDHYLRLREAELRETLTGLRPKVFEGKKVVINKMLDTERELDISAEITAADTWRYLHVFLILDEKTGKIAGLRFAPAGGVGRNIANWGNFGEGAGKLGGEVSMAAYELVRQNPGDPASPLTLKVITEVDADQRLNIGPAFGMYVLAALGDRVQKGGAKWSDTLTLREELISLPPGVMQEQAAGSTHTLEAVAERMFALGDNTAMDHLIHLMGRDAVEAYMATVNLDAERSAPVLMTSELFRIKESEEVLARYAAAGVVARRAMLADEVRKLPLPDEEWEEPREVSRVGWFASASECCRVMMELHKLERLPGMEPLSRALRRDPGLRLDRDLWPEVAFKGGAEAGVLSMTWLLERDDGKRFVLSMAWNHEEKPVQEGRMNDMARSALRLLGQHGRERQAPAPVPAEREPARPGRL